MLQDLPASERGFVLRSLGSMFYPAAWCSPALCRFGAVSPGLRWDIEDLEIFPGTSREEGQTREERGLVGAQFLKLSLSQWQPCASKCKRQ